MSNNMERSHRVETLDLIDDLNKAMIEHHHWTLSLHEQLICQLDDGLQVMDNNAHHKCRFGKWYDYAATFFKLNDNSIYKHIGEVHEKLHEAARLMHIEAKTHQPLPVRVFQDYSVIASQLNDLTHELELSIWKSVCLTDELTGLRNRQGMLIELRDERQRSIRSKTSCAIAIGDIDHFKNINDSYGHLQGDSVLKTIANCLSAEMRAYDRIYRYGGEEFLLCFPDTGSDKAMQILERIRHKISEQAIIIDSAEAEVKITISFGLAMISNISLEETIYHADEALLCAKKQGRNCVVVSQ